MGNKVVVCDKGGKKTKLVKEAKSEKILAKGGTLGICAWQD
jgi:hypothetical protein